MSKTTTIRTRIDSDLKEKTEKILENLGLNISEAMRLFCKQVTLHEGLPFDVRIPNKKTIKAMKEALDRKGITKTTLADLKREFK